MSHFASSRLILVLFSMALFFASERYLSDYEFHGLALVLSLLLFVISIVFSMINLSRAKGNHYDKEVKIWQYALLWKIVILLSCGFYFAFLSVMGDVKIPGTLPQKAFLVLWILSLILGLGLGIGAELGIRSSGRGDSADPQRVFRQMKNWAKTATLLCSLLAINYAMAKKDKAFDLSYLKTTLPGDATKSMVELANKDIKIAGFFKRDSEVAPLVREFLTRVASYNDRIELNYFDKDFAPVEAEEYRVAKNGQIILMTENNRQRIDLSEDLARARSKLKKLDELFQKSFLAITAEKKNVYFTQGHGEMSTSSRKIEVRSASQFTKLLRTVNYNARTINTAQKGYFEVPDDAHLLVIVGAAKRFTKEETEEIAAYVAKGGALLVFLDIEFSGAERDLLENEENPLLTFLEKSGFTYRDTKLVNEKKHIRATHKKIDRTFLASNNFSSHVSVKSLAKNEERMAVLTFQSGYLEPTKKIEGSWKIIKTIQTFPETFADTNNNLEFDNGEIRQPYTIAMAGESEKGRIIVFSDATMVSNPLLGNAGNQMAALDSVKWLIGQEKIIGEISSEEDVKIQHSKSRELFVFHGSIYLVPLLVLGIGFIVNRQRRGVRS